MEVLDNVKILSLHIFCYLSVVYSRPNSHIIVNIIIYLLQILSLSLLLFTYCFLYWKIYVQPNLSESVIIIFYYY